MNKWLKHNRKKMKDYGVTGKEFKESFFPFQFLIHSCRESSSRISWWNKSTSQGPQETGPGISRNPFHPHFVWISVTIFCHHVLRFSHKKHSRFRVTSADDDALFFFFLVVSFLGWVFMRQGKKQNMTESRERKWHRKTTKWNPC